MKLLQSQMILLLSKKDLYILLSSFLILFVFLLYSSGYYQDLNFQVVYRQDLFFDYLNESISFIKFISVIYGIYLSILARKLHHLDGFFLSRSTRMKIIGSRLFALSVYLVVIITIVYVLFLCVGFFLTSIMIEYDYISLFFTLVLFSLFYMFLSYLVMLSVHVSYSPIFVLLLYFVGTIFSPYYSSAQEATISEKIVNFLLNDLILFSDHTIAPFYGNFHVVTFIILILSTVICLFNNKDIITL
jgi:hypothetical protein